MRWWGHLWGLLGGRAGCGALLIWLVVFGHATRALGEPEKPVRWREVWSGADATANGWLIFSGITIAPMSEIHAQGVRFRMATGYGEYRYSGLRRSVSFNPVVGRHVENSDTVKFQAQTGFVDALAGYLWRLDPLIVKVFVGASGVGHGITPLDPENLATGLEWGPKGVAELWLNMGEEMWSSLDLSWSSAHNTRSARGRIGYRLMPKFSLGLEARIDIDAQGDCDIRWEETSSCKEQYRNRFGSATSIWDYSRGGVFGRFEWEGGEISAAVGLSGAIMGRDGDLEPQPYGTVSWITQF